MCQSVARPSSEQYWHMGDTPMRLRSVMDLMVNGATGVAYTRGADLLAFKKIRV